jgi:Gpi18-like mannosyltransferase
MKYFKEKIKKIPVELKYTLLLFLGTRTCLIIIGVLSRFILKPFHHKPAEWLYHGKIWLDMWGLWDTGWYLRIAQEGYTNQQAMHGVASPYGFFPLYPLIIKLTGFLTGNNFIAGIIISNISLILSCLLLYRLVKLDYDENTALNSIKYLFLFPTAFVFSGVFTESLYLMLVISCFYYAKTGTWFKAGIAGFFLSLVRPWGVFIIFPLLYEYLRKKDFQFSKIRADLFWQLLVPLGILIFFCYCWRQTGDFFVFIHTEEKAWYHKMTNSFSVLSFGLRWPYDSTVTFAADLMLIACFLVPIIFYVLGASYGLFALYSVLLPLVYSFDFHSAPRYLLPVFPFYILLAKLKKSRGLDEMITASLALLQGFLMVFWANGFDIVK